MKIGFPRDEVLVQYDRGDISFIIISGAMVFFMIPGLAFLYSGLARRKSALSLIWAVSASNAVCIFQWYLWGYSLSFSPSATNGFIGNIAHFGLIGILDAPSPASPLIPALLYAFFQMEFACVTVAILMGAVAERGRVMPAMLFSFLWLTLVYCPLACWAWNKNGWAFKWGVLDYAGGGPVEIGSGVAGLAYSWVLGRRQPKSLVNFRPHNVSLVNLGTFILWFGWLAFNGGSAFGANLRAVVAIWNSMLAASFGGVVWCVLDWRIERKWSMVGFCSGTIAGLVAATPSSGYIHPWAAVISGILAGGVTNYSTKLKFLLRIDDALDLLSEHAIGGIIGLLINGLFASSTITVLDGVSIRKPGGWVDHNYKQLYIQLAYILAACSYTFVVSAALAAVLNLIPGMRLRVSEEGEQIGVDEAEIGEFANDYIEVRRDYMDWSLLGAAKQEKECAVSEPTTTTTDSVSTSVAGDRHAQPGLETISEKPTAGEDQTTQV